MISTLSSVHLLPNTKEPSLNFGRSEVASLLERGVVFFQSGQLIDVQSVFNEILTLDPNWLFD